MDTQKYDQISLYLQQQVIPSNLTPNRIKSFITLCGNFQVKNNYLYKKDKRKENNLLRVIRRFEMEPILYMMHNDPTAGHFATDIMFNKIRDRYYWPQMFEDIRAYVQSCDPCQRRGKSQDRQLLNPIPIHSPFHQIGIDFVGPLPRTEKGNRYILVAMDYFTKWPEAKPLPRATAELTSDFIYNEIICRHGCPKYILSDRGTHFNNQLIKDLMQKFEIQHLLSSPYHPQTNGLVERFNRTLCESLAKLVNKVDQWDDYIAPILFAYRTSKQATMKITPFFLTYGREAVLPLDDLSGEIETVQQRLRHLIDDLPQIREGVRQHVHDKQNKQKDYHDQQITKPLKLQIGDKVLYYKAAMEKQWSGKLEEKWKGPYYIHSTGSHGTYKLRTLEGQILKAPINGSLLKLYKDRISWDPLVTIHPIPLNEDAE